MNADNKRWIAAQMIWLGISLGISITLSLLLPFYLSLPISILVLILLSFFVRRRALQKMGGASSGWKGFGSMGGGGISFVCINCGYKHKQRACPKCGSRGTKANF